MEDIAHTHHIRFSERCDGCRLLVTTYEVGFLRLDLSLCVLEHRPLLLELLYGLNHLKKERKADERVKSGNN